MRAVDDLSNLVRFLHRNNQKFILINLVSSELQNVTLLSKSIQSIYILTYYRSVDHETDVSVISILVYIDIHNKEVYHFHIIFPSIFCSFLG